MSDVRKRPSFIMRTRRAPKPVAYVIADLNGPEPPTSDARIRAQSCRARKSVRAKNRILMCAVAFVFVFVSLGARLAFVSFGAVEPQAGGMKTIAANAPRPEIVDRNGALLATDLPVIAVEIAGGEVWDPREAAQALAGALEGVDALALEQKLREGRYVEARSDLTPTERQAVFELGLPGVRFAARTKRFYPQADLAAHVVGHTEPGNGGVMGLERVINQWRGAEPARASIDIRVQQILEDEISAAMEKFAAIAAWGAVMDAATGEVIALASFPDFDPNAPGAAAADFRRNRAVYDRYELGSAFKPITAAAALDAGVATETAKYDARGSFQVANRRIRDFHGENRVLTLSEVIQFSSNIGAARIAGDLGPARFKTYLQKLGLLEAAPIALAERREPDLPAKWGPVETATIAYGHGISVTPLHLLTAFTAVVNGGRYCPPTFFMLEGPPQDRAVFSKETSAVMRRILRRVVTDGTASFAEVPGLFPIGKTGTAEKPALGGYDNDARISSFIGAFPGYAPRYAVLVSFDEPQPLKETYGYATAGWNAAPTFAKIVERSAPILGVAPVNEAEALAAFVTGEFEPARESAQVEDRPHSRPAREARLDASVRERAP
jgi:cell division protein FtsI (penicillin-binding protein 3)